MELMFVPVPPEALSKKDILYTKGIPSTKRVIRALKQKPDSWAVFLECQRLIATARAIKTRSTASKKNRFGKRRKDLRMRVRACLRKALDLGLGSLQEIRVHCKTYEVYPL